MQATFDLQTSVSEAFASMHEPDSPTELTLIMNGPGAHLLDRLAEILHRERGDVIGEALALLFIGVTAQKNEMRMAVVDSEDQVQTSFELLSRD